MNAYRDSGRYEIGIIYRTIFFLVEPKALPRLHVFLATCYTRPPLIIIRFRSNASPFRPGRCHVDNAQFHSFFIFLLALLCTAKCLFPAEAMNFNAAKLTATRQVAVEKTPAENIACKTFSCKTRNGDSLPENGAFCFNLFNGFCREFILPGTSELLRKYTYDRTNNYRSRYSHTKRGEK